MVNKDSVFAEMETLSKEIAYHADLYFNKDITLIPNHVYDDKVKRFEELREAHPELAELFELHNRPVPIHEPGGAGLKIVTLASPMLSLKKALDHNAVEVFKKKFPDDEFYDEYKLDGLALSLFYSKKDSGLYTLDSIFTRGSGLEGEDVTHAVPLFNHNYFPTSLVVPKGTPDKLEVRGEAFMTIGDFNLYNEVSPKQKTTPRNAASGFVRALEKNMDKNAKGLLLFNVYWSDYTFGVKLYKNLRYKWALLGFKPAPEATEDDYRRDRYLLDFPVDGIVKKLNNLARWDEVGVTNQYPNYAIAYKFPNEEKETTPVSVDWQIGKTGRVTPCINYVPVRLGGVICDRASLDNVYQFLALELREDTTISISRNGDVIPRLHHVVEPGVGTLFAVPTECPACGSVLETRKGVSSAELICNNVAECPGQLLMRCVAMAGKKCLDIDGLGAVKLGQLIDFGIIQNTADVIWMDKGKYLGDKVYERIVEARTRPWHIIIKALGLPNIDLTRAKKLADALPELLRKGEAPNTDVLDFLGNPDKVMKVPGFGPGLALPIAAVLRNELFYENAENILKRMQVDTNDVIVLEIKGVVSGTLGQTRDELVEYFGEYGIELVENLTKDCQFLLLGEKPSKSKILKATELRIPTVEGSKASSIDKLIEEIKGLKQ